MAINSSGDITLEGTLTAENYVVSSSVTNQTIAGVSGSTSFGDDSSDTHQFSGSIDMSGSSGMTVTSGPSNNHLKLISAGSGGNLAIRFDVEKTATNYVDWQILQNSGKFYV